MDGRLQNEMKIDGACNIILETLPSYVQKWNLNMKASRKTAATRRNYLTTIKELLVFINEDPRFVRPENITEDKVTEYIVKIQYKKNKYGELIQTSDGYQATVWFVFNNFFKFMVDEGLMSKNYMSNITRVKNRDLERINQNRVLLTADDFKRILDFAETEDNDPWIKARNKAILLVFMNTGIRKTALLTIGIDDVDLKEHTLLFIDKGGKRHEYYLNDQVIEAISEWLSVRRRSKIGVGDDHLFVSLNGTAFADKTLEYMVKRYTKKVLGHPMSPHKLRAGYCSILYEQTGDIEFVRRAVGHSNVATTQRYVVTKGSEKKRAAEIMGSLL